MSSTNFEINAQIRDTHGTAESRRLRHTGRIPAIIYGAGKDNIGLTLDHDSTMHQLAVEAFHSAIIDVNTGKSKEQAILRDVQMHPYKSRILHIDFQRVSASQALHMSVPLHVTGEDAAPGVKQSSGIVSHLMNDIEISCLPKDLPEYLEIDISSLEMNESLHLTDIKLPEGVVIVSMSHGGEDLAVVAIVAPKVEVEETDEELEGAADVPADSDGDENAGE
ncbi:MAG: 50S ribosomal protein L25/general stress protein Ctc [Arenicellales bacterium WSBS_2016_MAG_OTU3]